MFYLSKIGSIILEYSSNVEEAYPENFAYIDLSFLSYYGFLTLYSFNSYFSSVVVASFTDGRNLLLSDVDILLNQMFFLS